jgi:sulfur-oxidizing protein SoxY
MIQAGQAGLDDPGRRQFLELGGGAALLGALAAAGILGPLRARAAEWNRAAFEAKSVGDVYAALGARESTVGAGLVLDAPDLAENGALVPITVTSELPRTEAIAIVADQNPTMLVASFVLPAGTLPYVSTRLKLARTSSVSVLVRAGGAFHVASKEVRVTVGGCG